MDHQISCALDFGYMGVRGELCGGCFSLQWKWEASAACSYPCGREKDHGSTCLRDMKGQWKRLAAVLARRDPLFPLNINLLMTASSLFLLFVEKWVPNTVLVTIPNLALKT